MQNNNQWYDPNNVNADNFNVTMKGYIKKAIKEMEISLKGKNYTHKQIEEIKKYFNWGIEWAVDIMTMEEARKYYNK